MKPIFAETCVDAWLQVLQHLESTDWRDYNIVISVKSSMKLPPRDKRIVEILNRFLQIKAGKSIQTVINTIFPVDLYIRGGPDTLFSDYDRLWPRLASSKETRRWGTYFRRMTSRTMNGITVRPLENILKRMKSELKASTKHACYELGPCDPFLDIPISDPAVDAANLMGSPCLSHVSFKISQTKCILLTGFYRSHYYIERALGNLFGLAWLQYFVAQEVGLATGELVCHSSMAFAETTTEWNRADVIQLIRECKKA